MSFGGPIDSMQNSQRSNKGLLRSRKRLKEIQENYPAHRKQQVLKEKNQGDEATTQGKGSIKYTERNRTFIKVLVTLLIVMMLAWWLMSRDPSAIIELIR
jgi:hypothetical protein